MNGAINSQYEQIERLKLLLPRCSPKTQLLLIEKLKQEQVRREIAAGKRLWKLDDLFIQTKDGRLISLGKNLNEVQINILDDVAPRWRHGDCTVRKSLRAYELKARQFGVSTLYLGLYFLGVINNADSHAVVIADNQENTEALFQKAHIFYEHLDEGRRPTKRRSNTRELAFDGLRSTFRVLTAGRKGAGRSRTIQWLHCSEVAFWRDAGTVMGGLMQAVPAGGCITIESTANGEGSVSAEGEIIGGEGAFFHVEYQRAVADANGFEARFTPWYSLSSYRADITEPLRRIDPFLLRSLESEHGAQEGKRRYLALCKRYLLEDYTDPAAEFAALNSGEMGDRESVPSESEYARRFGLDDGQLLWRRRKIDEPGQGPIFKQEYPTTQEEAFLVSGAAFFTAWNESEHTCPKRPVLDWWDWHGGYDWGTLSPFGFLLGAWSPDGRVELCEEAYAPGKTEEEQAALIIDRLQERGFTKRGGWWGIEPQGRPWRRLDIHADPSIFPASDVTKRVGVSRAEKFWTLGLHFVPADNNREATNGNARNYMQRPGMLTVQRTCPNLIRTIPLARRDPRKREDFILVDDHMVDTARYILFCRPLAHETPEDKAKREDEADLIKRLKEMGSSITGAHLQMGQTGGVPPRKGFL